MKTTFTESNNQQTLMGYRHVFFSNREGLERL